MMKALICGSLGILLGACAGEGGESLELEKSSSLARALTPADQCTPEERDHWDRRALACTGPWVYLTYDCFRKGRTPSCGFSHFESNPVIGTLSCEHPDNGAVRWTLAQTQRRTVTYLDLPGYENFLLKEAKRMYGDQALGVFKITYGNIGGLHQYLSPMMNDREIAFTEVYYQKVDDNHWAVESSFDHRMQLGNTLTKQHIVMEHAKKHLRDGFGIAKWDVSSRPVLQYTPGYLEIFSVEEQFYKPAHFAVKPHPACGVGEIGREVDQSKLVYKECRHHENGREQSNVCRAPETRQTSLYNLGRDELPAEHAYAHQGAVCSTADALDMAAPFRARFDAFKAVAAGRLGHDGGPLPVDVATEHTRRLALKKLKYLYERQSSSLTPEQREFLPEVYKATPQVNACGTSSGGAGCTSKRLELLGLLEHCHRLSLDHVSARNTQEHLQGCFAAAAQVAEDPSLQLTRRALMDASHRMLEKYIARAIEEQLPLCEDGTSFAAGMIDAWFLAAQSRYDGSRALSLRAHLTQLLAEQCL